MPFRRDHPDTIAAAKRGGKSGRKYLQTLSREDFLALSSKAGKRSVQRRRQIKKAKFDVRPGDIDGTCA